LDPFEKSRNRAYKVIFGWWALFAALLAVVTYSHEMYLDEVQPWLWVRYEHNLLTSIQHLHYEAHPALWTILLVLLSRVCSNVLLMQWANYVLAIACAMLILTARRVPLPIRVISVFGSSFFFIAGVLARNYMLPALLLIGAARCLLAEPKRLWVGMLLLALSINSHFLAIPVAASIFLWLYWFEPEMTRSSAVTKLRDRKFWGCCALLFVSLLACYFTVRPASDIQTTEDLPGATLFEYFVLGVGRIWHYFVPVSVDASSAIKNGGLTVVAYIDLLITLVLFAAALMVLPSRRSRYFMATASLLFESAALFTVRRPLETHSTLLIVSYLVALLARRSEDGLGSWIPEYAAQPVLITILSTQVLICSQFALKEETGPFSAGKPVAEWIERQGLADHPIVSQPEIAAPAVMAYTGAPTVYFPGCQCNRPYVLYRRGWDSTRSITTSELKALKAATGLAPVVLSSWTLSDSDQKAMGLRFGFKSPTGWAFDNENVSVYVADATVQ